jgi:hypothetical protein
MTQRPVHSQLRPLLLVGVAVVVALFCLADPVAAEDILDEANTIAAKVGEIRGLPPKGMITNGFKTREELRAVVETKLAEEYSAQRIADDGDMLVRLGMLPKGTDYGKLIVELLTEQIAGFYDHEADELYLIEGGDPATQRITIAHEIFHGIQDQHFDLATVLPPKEGPFGRDRNDDYSLATSALVEGDATILMFDFTYRDNGLLPPGTSLVDSPLFDSFVTPMLENMDPAALGQSPALASAPPWLTELLVFPYLRGMGFVAKVRGKSGSWARVNAAYGNPPRSTEHILHPDKYLAQEAPVGVVLDTDEIAKAAALGSTGPWTPMYDNVMGELQLRLWLIELGLDKDSAARAAAGWGGDRIAGFRGPKGQILGVLATVWDSEEEAIEFAGALERATAAQRPDFQATVRKGKFGQFVCGVDGGERITVERWGDWVVWTAGLPQDAPVRNLRQAIWDGRSIAPY